MHFRTLSIAFALCIAFIFGVAGCTREGPSKDENPTTPQVTPKKEPKDERVVKVEPKKEGDPYEWKKVDGPNPQLPPINPWPPDDVVVKPTPGEKQEPKGTKNPKEKKENEPPKFVVPKEVLGKTFAQWKAECKSKDPTKREIAMKTILFFGPDKAYEVLPDIIAELKKHTANTPVDLSVRVNGTMAMSAIFASKKEPDPKLVEEAFAIFKRFMADPQVILKTRAVQGVPSLGPKAYEAIEEVMKVARDRSTWEVRKEGLIVLTQMAMNMKPMHAKIPAELRGALDDNAVQVRLVGLQTLAALKDRLDADEKKQTLETLESYAKKETDPGLQLMANAAIITISGEVSHPHLTAMIKMLTHKDIAVCMQALNVIGALGPKGQAALNDVADVARSAEVTDLRKEGLATVMKLGFDGKKLHPKVLPTLLQMLEDNIPEVRLPTLNAIAALNAAFSKNEKDDALAKLAKHAQTEKDPTIRLWTFATSMTVAQEVNTARVTPVVEMLKHKETFVRLQAFQVLAMAGKDAKEAALPTVLETIQDKELTVAVAAVDLLPELHAFETLPMLKKMMEDMKLAPELRGAATEAHADLLEIMAEEKANKEKKDKESKK